MSYEIVAYETPYVWVPKNISVHGTKNDAVNIADSLTSTNYEVYVRDSDGNSVYSYVNGLNNKED